MDNHLINRSLIDGSPDREGVLPHVESLREVPFVFEQDFGLPELPIQPGVILIRGPRQYGKSTWLEQQILQTIKQFGKGTALYLNGDEIKDSKDFIQEIRNLIPLFSSTAPVKRLFIDEITAIDNWQKGIKRLLDAGELKKILLVTTGSKASDLRRGVERLPGRKGQLAKTNYIFTPISYREFKNKCGEHFKEDSLFAYILSGGSPVGANALASLGRIPDYVSSIVSDWIYGEFAASGRSRSHLLAVLQSLYRMAGNPIGQAKLARESGLSNNTTAQGYIDLLSDLMTVVPSFPYDKDKGIALFRKPCKYQFVNLLAALCWHPKKPCTIEELKGLNEDLGPIFEWVVAQEIWRRLCISHSEDMPEHLHFWQSKEHEIDFVLPDKQIYIEVKAGKNEPSDFIWFFKSFSKNQLLTIGKNRFDTERIQGITMEDFLLGY
jgi:predicted AAA+ superfamily ATPase